MFYASLLTAYCLTELLLITFSDMAASWSPVEANFRRVMNVILRHTDFIITFQPAEKKVRIGLRCLDSVSPSFQQEIYFEILAVVHSIDLR